MAECDLGSQRFERPIDPALPICDAHHHLWDRPNDRYLLDRFHEEAGGQNIVSTVIVECGERYRTEGPIDLRPVGETEFVEELIAVSGSPSDRSTAVAAGIVGHADLTLGSAVLEVLEAHLAASPERFRGIRHSCCWDDCSEIHKPSTNPTPQLMSDSTFREGLATLQRYDLTFEAWVYQTQLAELQDLARSVPGVLIILNHTGGLLGIGPYRGRRDALNRAWQQEIAALATCPNVVVKLGGLGMPRCGFGWHARSEPATSAGLAEEMAPYHLFCIEQFGVDRCLFESNFPVDRVSYSYIVLWNAFKRLAENFSPAERAALFHDTAARVYRLVKPAVTD